MRFNRLQGAVLAGCVVALVLVCFVGGFFSAVYLGELDPSTATNVTKAAVGQSEYLARARAGLLSRGQQIARRPVFAVSTFAARPVQAFYKTIPGALRPVSPQAALDQALRAQATQADVAVASAARQTASAVQADTSPGAGPSATQPGAAAPATDAPPAGATPPATAAAEKPAAVPDVPVRTLPPASIVPGSAYAVELASFLQPDTARKFAAAMQDRKLPVSIVVQKDAGGRDWQRVRLGPFPTQDQAARQVAALQADNLPGVVVEEPAVSAPS